MSTFELKLPKMGESIAEATITNWLKNVGDTIEADEAVLEIATDKVDSEVPSEVDGVLVQVLFQVNDVVQVGETLAIIETDGGTASPETPQTTTETPAPEIVAPLTQKTEAAETAAPPRVESTEDRFYSPLVKNIAKAEGISQADLDGMVGTGQHGRVTKNDILSYLKNRGPTKEIGPGTVEGTPTEKIKPQTPPQLKSPGTAKAAPVKTDTGDTVIELSRMGKLVAQHMVHSTQTSAHVQSFVECDVTHVWNWREKV
ncbi:MAG: biotin/lipoyl-containing protein, partial [Marinirhabdus sp.]